MTDIDVNGNAKKLRIIILKKVLTTVNYYNYECLLSLKLDKI